MADKPEVRLKDLVKMLTVNLPPKPGSSKPDNPTSKPDEKTVKQDAS